MAAELPNPVVAPKHVHALLDRLHAVSNDQEAHLDRSVYQTTDTAAFDDIMRDKFIALEQDKCHFVYQVARMIAAKNIVEAGTSYGVSTIYLALAVGQNTAGNPGEHGKVFATEKEVSKIKVAKEHWKEAGGEVEPFIELREGDLLKTLAEGLPTIDLLLLDIWSPLALPTLKIVQRKLRAGGVVIADNTISSKDGYKELLQHLRAPDSGFTNLTLPYHNGLELCVYNPTS